MPILFCAKYFEFTVECETRNGKAGKSNFHHISFAFRFLCLFEWFLTFAHFLNRSVRFVRTSEKECLVFNTFEWIFYSLFSYLLLIARIFRSEFFNFCPFFLYSPIHSSSWIMTSRVYTLFGIVYETHNYYISFYVRMTQFFSSVQNFVIILISVLGAFFPLSKMSVKHFLLNLVWSKWWHHLQKSGFIALGTGMLISLIFGFVFGLIVGATEQPWGLSDWPTEEMKGR